MRVVTFGRRGHRLAEVALKVAQTTPGLHHVAHVDIPRRSHADVQSENGRKSLAALHPDLFVSAAYTQILQEVTLAIPSIGGINVHPSLLPDYRGSHPLYWALYEGADLVGVTIHEMVKEVDAGKILAQRSFPVVPGATADEMYDNVCLIAEELLESTLRKIQRVGRLDGVEQSGVSSYRRAPSKEPERLELDWTQLADELARRACIFPGSVNYVRNGRRTFVNSIERTGRFSERPAGTFLRRRPGSVDVVAGEGVVVHVSVRDSWWRGRRKLGRLLR